MYRSINQIFYNNNKFDTEKSILDISKFSLMNDLLEDISEKIEIQENKIPKNPENLVNKIPKKIENTENKIQEKIENTENKIQEKIEIQENKIKEIKWFCPKHIDTIFWCVFSHIYGFGEYQQIGHAYGNRILEEKMKIVESIKKTPKILKESNIKITTIAIQEVISEFMVDNTTSFNGIIALAIYYKIPIYLINQEKKTFLKYIPNERSDNPCFLYYNGKNYKISLSEMKPPNIDLLICLESHLKPFKPSSNYKMEQLDEIAQKIGYVPEKRMKKMELYEKLSELCSWL